MGGWMVIDQTGTLLFLNVDLIIANKFLGSIAAGEYGSILLFSSLLRGFAATVSTVLGPNVVAKYALNDLDGMSRVSVQALRLMGLALALPVGLICGLGGPFLQLWLGKDFGSLWLLLVLLTFHLSVNLAVSPTGWINTALNKVKIPGIVTLVMGFFNLLLALFFTIVLNWGVYGIAAAGAIVLTLKNVFFNSIYVAYIQKLPWYTYIRPLVPGLVTTLLVGLVCLVTTSLIRINNWGSMILIGAIIGSLSLGAVFILGLKKEDQTLVLSFVLTLKKS
jgi:membrane protein EpsK